MEERPTVTCFLQNDGELLLMRRSDAAGSEPGRWGTVGGHIPDDVGREPGTAARAEIAEAVGLEADVELVRRGEPFPVEDTDQGARWLVYPFLFDCASRAVETNADAATAEWVHPPELLRRATVPRLWTSYDRVRPRVATLDDRDHGSAWLSLRALAVLRDEAALAGAGRHDDRERAERDGDDWDALAALARRLRSRRPSMVAVSNRVNRAMADAGRSPSGVEQAARGGIERAASADRRAAATAAERLPARVATLSRSGTVLRAIERAEPEGVLVAASRPGGEGVAAAERLADATDVTLTTDAALGHALATTDVDALVVGADRVLPDGRVVNKVGTRGAALAARATGMDVFVVTATAKVAPDDGYDLEPRDPTEVYDGDAALAVENPTFDVTPADAVSAVLTEDGALSADGISDVAAAHAERADWGHTGGCTKLT